MLGGQSVDFALANSGDTFLDIGVETQVAAFIVPFQLFSSTSIALCCSIEPVGTNSLRTGTLTIRLGGTVGAADGTIVGTKVVASDGDGTLDVTIANPNTTRRVKFLYTIDASHVFATGATYLRVRQV